VDGVAQADVPILPLAIFAQFSLVFGDAPTDTSLLTVLLHRNANEVMLSAIATEYAKGRLLLIGAIAASGHPDALRLFHSILSASASIPGAFPPVLVDVALDGRAHQKMHVDGGASTQVFL